MTRPVSAWQWTSTGEDEHPTPDAHELAASIFWLRMEHLRPSHADRIRETYPPDAEWPIARPMQHQRAITTKQLDDCITESFTWKHGNNQHDTKEHAA